MRKRNEDGGIPHCLLRDYMERLTTFLISPVSIEDPIGASS
mgnify:CR=1 FL=1